MLPSSVRLSAFALSCAILMSGSAAAQISFLDHRQKQVALEAPAKRVVSAMMAGAIGMLSVEQSAEHIVGLNASVQQTFSETVYAELFPELLQISGSAVTEGFAPNVEAILELNPDLVIQWIYDPTLIEPLERVGLRVMGWDCCTEQHRRDYLMMSGYASGKIARAQAILNLQDASNAGMKELFAKTAPEEYVTMLEVDQVNDQIRVVANNSQDYALSGIRNLAADDSGEWWRTIDAEQFLAWNPQIIIIPAWEALLPAALYENPLLASVNAIKNKRVYKVPRFNRSPDAPEVYLTAVWLAAISHPDMAADKDLRALVSEAYSKIYGKTLMDAQVDSILEIEANAGSDGYAERFR